MNPIVNRIFSKIERKNDCWIWKDAPNQGGYGRLRLEGKPRLAHRVCYELFKGEIPKDYILHHTCENKKCVNPDHLEAITRTEHLFKVGHMAHLRLSTTHCPQGHEYATENTIITKAGRVCRKCVNERNKKKYIPRPRPQKTHCPKGHPYDGDNLKMKSYRSGTYRACKQCNRDEAKEYYYRKKESNGR